MKFKVGDVVKSKSGKQYKIISYRGAMSTAINGHVYSGLVISEGPELGKIKTITQNHLQLDLLPTIKVRKNEKSTI